MSYVQEMKRRTSLIYRYFIFSYRRSEKPVTHLRSKVTVSMMTDDVKLPTKELPPELYYLIRRSKVIKNFLWLFLVMHTICVQTHVLINIILL